MNPTAAPSIRSRSNALVRSLRLLCSSAEERRQQGAYVASGVRLVEEAVSRDVALQCAVCSPRLLRDDRGRALQQQLRQAAHRVETVTDDLLGWILGTPGHQGVAARVTREESTLDELMDGSLHPLLLVAWGVQDPGNLGGLLRVTAAAGGSGVLAVEGCADLYNPKVVRASGGALFHLPALSRVPGPTLLERLAAAGYTRVGAVARGGTRYDTLGWNPPTAVVVGGEGAGLPEAAVTAMEQCVSIPMAAGMESLNVLSAATLILYQAARHLSRA
jgi:TrmH family RNA methyltransferase